MRQELPSRPTGDIMFLLIVVISLRAGQRWAWRACWTVQ